MSRPSRRDLLGAAGFTMLSGISAAALARPDALPAGEAVPPIHPDAALIALSTRFVELERLCAATYGSRTIEEEHAAELTRVPWEEEQEALFEKIMATRATTLDGYRARARMFASWSPELERKGGDGGFWSDRMAWALVRDLVGRQDHG